MNYPKCRERVILAATLTVLSAMVAGSSIENPKVAFGIGFAGLALIALGILISLDRGPSA